MFFFVVFCIFFYIFSMFFFGSICILLWTYLMNQNFVDIFLTKSNQECKIFFNETKYILMNIIFWKIWMNLYSEMSLTWDKLGPKLGDKLGPKLGEKLGSKLFARSFPSRRRCCCSIHRDLQENWRMASQRSTSRSSEISASAKEHKKDRPRPLESSQCR
jgi:hypothetical protein